MLLPRVADVQGSDEEESEEDGSDGEGGMGLPSPRARGDGQRTYAVGLPDTPHPCLHASGVYMHASARIFQ